MPPAKTMSYFQTAIILILLAGITLTLSFGFFFNQSLRLDESQSLWQSSHSLRGIIYIVAQDVHLPLYHILLHFWQYWWGEGLETGRLLSLLFLLLSIPLFYLLGKTLFDEATSLFASLLFVISPFMNWFGNEIRMYSLLTFLGLANQLFFLKIYYRDNSYPKLIWLGYAFTTIAGIYTHYFFFLILAAQGLFFVVYHKLFPPQSLRYFLTVLLLVAVSISPWLMYVNSLGLASNYRPLIPEPTVISVFNTFSNLIAGFHDDKLNSLILSLWPLLVLLGFLGLQRNKNFTPEINFLLYGVFLPILLAFGASFVLRPIYLSRYLIIALPPLYLLFAWLISRYPPRLALLAKSGLAGLMMVMLFVQSASSTTPVKENYRAASDYLSRYATAQDIIVASAPFTIYPLDYYYRGATPITTFPVWDRFLAGPIPAFSSEQLPEEAGILAQRHQKLWLLLSYDQGYEETIRLYFDNNFQRLETQEFSPGLSLYVYQLRYDQESFEEVLARLSREPQGIATRETTTPPLVQGL